MNPTNQQEDFRLIACPHVFSIEKGRIDALRPAGGTVNDLIRSIGWTPDGLSARVFIDGEYVKDAAWEYTVTRPGQSVVVRAVPMGGEGGGKDVGRIVAMVAIMALAIAVSGGALAPLAAAFGAGGMGLLAAGSTYAVLLGASISIVGSLALTGLIPSPLPRRALPQPLDDHREVAA